MAHDLHDYMSQISKKMEAEYARIRKSAAADPGTAGDEGEENWAQLLREWLPPTYRVVTKGQLIDEAGKLSPQIDVIVLKPSYPGALHHKKKYLIAGVAAAFECKLTLKKSDIFSGVQAGVDIKRLSSRTNGTPYRELMCEPIFGILTHAHSWRGTKSNAVTTIDAHLRAADLHSVGHPRETLDLLCVSSLATWVMSKDPLLEPEKVFDPTTRSATDSKCGPATTYFCHEGDESAYRDGQSNPFTPIGVFVSELLVKLAWRDQPLRDIASYFLGVEFSSSSSGKSRHWTKRVYSPPLRRKISAAKLSNVIDWNEWAASIE